MGMDLSTSSNNGVVALDGQESLQAMQSRLQEMTGRLSIVQQFFKQVMVKDTDYGVIPGTDKPTLYKPGAEKLCEFYGYSIRTEITKETQDRETGYCEYVVTVSLVSKRTSEIVAQGVGSANTYENRYRWRWVPEWKLPKGVDKSVLHSEERTSKKGKPFVMYRLENEDLFSLWNTVLKMAKKRGLIDATLSATRSSGLFTQDVEDLQHWADSAVDAEYTVRDGEQSSEPKATALDKYMTVAASKGLSEEQSLELLCLTAWKVNGMYPSNVHGLSDTFIDEATKKVNASNLDALKAGLRIMGDEYRQTSAAAAYSADEPGGQQVDSEGDVPF